MVSRIRFAGLAALGGLCFFATGALAASCPQMGIDAENPLAVLDHALTPEVVHSEPSPRLDGTVDLSATKKLRFWTLIAGCEDALNELRATGTLKITHAWTHWGADGGPEGGQEPAFSDDIVLTLNHRQDGPDGQAKYDEKARRLVATFELEVAARGYFDYRIWSTKGNFLLPGNWTFHVLHNGKAVRLPDGSEAMAATFAYDPAPEPLPLPEPATVMEPEPAPAMPSE